MQTVTSAEGVRSQLLQSVIGETSRREHERKQRLSEERRKEEGGKERDLVLWEEEKLFTGTDREKVESMWELAVIGHFVALLVEFYVRELLKLTMAMNSKEDKVTLSSLYDRIETQLRALETLGVATDKYAAMLFPLVESCLSEEVLRAWQPSGYVGSSRPRGETRPESLMRILKS